MSTTVLPSTAAAAGQDHATPALSPKLRRIVLTGFMGVGKSTVGALLADRLGWDFLDLDQYIEDRSGSTIAELFAHKGEHVFRRLESTALASALRRNEVVLALGGGTPEGLTNRLLLEQTPGTMVLFLDAPFPTLYDRCLLQGTDRPVLRDGHAAQLRFAERQPLYRRLARHTVSTSEADAPGVTELIVALLSPGAPHHAAQ